MVSVRCASDRLCLFSDATEKEELTPKSETVHISQITLKITSKQRRMLKDLDLSDCIRFHNSKRGRTTLIVTFPSEPFRPTLMNGMLWSLVNFSIHKTVLTFKPSTCIKACLHFGCTPLLELYVPYMKELSMRRAALVHCFNIIVKHYGFSFENSMMDVFFDMLEQRGISKDFLKLYLKNDKEFDLTELIESVKSLPPVKQFGWSPFLHI